MSRFRIFFVITLLFLSLGINSLASEGNHLFFSEKTRLAIETLDRDQGISNLSVSSIIQDKYGVLWFGTQDGLNRYDGRSVVTYKDQPFVKGDLTHNLIQTMYYDEEAHVLWMGTYNGVTRFDISQGVFKSYKPATDTQEGVPDPVVIAITKDQQGDMWFGTANGLDRLDVSEDLLLHYQIPGKTVRSLLTTSQGKVLIGSLEGLMVYDSVKDLVEPISIDLPSSYVMTLDEFVEGNYTLGLWGGGILVVDSHFHILSRFKPEDDRVYSVAMTSEGSLWIGTWGGGLFAMDKDGRTHRFTSGNEVDSIAHDVVYSLLEDETGSLWVGTNGGGISIINPRKRDYVYFSYDHDDPSSLDNGKINAITQDDRGNYWVSVYNNGINYLSPTGRVLKRYKTADENSIGDQVKVFLKDSKNRFLAGTDKGIAYYDPETDSFLLWDILPDRNRIYDIVETEEGVFWIGTYDEGLLRYDPASGELKNYPLSDTKVFSMLLDSKNRLWVGTNNGLNRMDQGEEVFITYRHDEPELGDLPGNSIEDIIEDSEGRIWLATSGGAALYQEETNDFKAFTENTGLLSNNVSALLECEHHIIWAATQNGITLIDEDKNLVRTLTPEQGIGGWEFGSGAYIDRDGNIMFGGVHGVTRIPDLHNPDVGFDYRTQITQVKVNESPVEEGQFIYNDSAYIFEPDQRFMTIEFITIDYDSPMAVDYEYRLLGLEDEWRQNGSRNEVSFINLSAGRYVFEVRSRMPNGDYTAPVSFSFEIKQYWYLMWYAFIIYTMLVFGIVFVIFEMRNARELNKRNIELDHLNDRLEQANTQLEKISVEDSLTGLYNRRFFDMKLDEQLHLAKRSKTSLALIMIDLDNFKEVNDTMGHVIGDRYLQRIASILGDTLQRSTDFACRYGGDEFIIMMYDNSIDGTRMVAERIRETVRNMVLVDEYSGQKIQGTVSIGIISTIPPMDADGDTYLEAVDKAMYQAKNAGRNRISVAILGDDEEEAPKA